jgi:hypothetical protein
MEICGTNVTEFSSYIVYQWLQCHTKRNLRHYIMKIGLHCMYIGWHLSVKPMEFCGTNVTEFPSYIVYQWLQCHTKWNLQHKCYRISIIYPIWGWRRAGLHCLSVTTMSNQVKSAARMSQNFHYIAYLGTAKGRDTLSVCGSTSVSQTIGILWRECRRISIIHCILVTAMCHQWKSVAWLSQNFQYSSILVTRMSHQWKSVAQMLQNFHHTLFISDYNVTPSKICGTI